METTIYYLRASDFVTDANENTFAVFERASEAIGCVRYGRG